MKWKQHLGNAQESKAFAVSSQLALLASIFLPGLLTVFAERALSGLAAWAYGSYLVAIIFLGNFAGFGRKALAAYLLLHCAAADFYLASYAITGSGPTLADALLLLKTTFRESLDVLRVNLPPALGFCALMGIQAAGIVSFVRKGLLPRIPPRVGIIAMIPLLLPFASAKIAEVYPLNLGYLALQVKAFYQVSAASSRSSVSGVRTTKGDAEQALVLVIGESSQAGYWQLFGYPRATSPNLAKRARAAELLTFPRHLSTAAATFAAVPTILGPYGTLTADSSRSEGPSLVSVMREGGFRTSWLSTQNAFRATAEAETVWFQDESALFQNEKRYDDRLIPRLSDWLSKTAHRKAFSVVHTSGSHFPFEARYPENFRKWGSIGSKFPANQDEDNYANSVLYTDFVLNGLISALEKDSRPSLLLYVSDHGETLMHGRMRSKLETIDTNVLHVPFFIWANKRWQIENPVQWEQLSKVSRSRAVTSHLDLAATLADIAGIEYDGKNMERALSSSTYAGWLRPPALGPGFSTVIEVTPPQ